MKQHATQFIILLLINIYYFAIYNATVTSDSFIDKIPDVI